MYVGGGFTDAGGNIDADRIATWDGTKWGNLGPSDSLNGDVFAIAYAGGKVYAGGVFTNAGGNPNADFLAVWDGATWAPFCNANGPAFGGNVHALKVIGSTLYVGGAFQNGAGIASADYLVACDLTSGAASSLVTNDGDVSGGVFGLAADTNGVLYAAGQFSNMARIPAADFVASHDAGGWHAMGSGAGPGGAALTTPARSIAANGTDVYVGTDSLDVATIPQADRLARWDGTAWSAIGSDTSGANGFFSGTSQSINAITVAGARVFAVGSFLDANSDPAADFIAEFDGSTWKPVGSNGAGDGPLNANTLALAVFGPNLYAGGNFTKAGGDAIAQFVASYALSPTGALPPPTEGGTVNAVPVKGTVLVKLPPGSAGKGGGGATGFVPLESLGRQIPVGSTLDTKKGTVRLFAAVNTVGKTQSGDFSRGLFNISQGRKNPLTTLSMTGGGLGACSKLPAGGSPKPGVAGAAKRRRSLFSNVKGRFRTRGRNSTATVRGTAFTMTDTCAGTLTQVTKGTVLVRDFRLRKTRKVKAGHSYLARALPLKKH